MMPSKFRQQNQDEKMKVALIIVTQALAELREHDLTEAQFRARLDELTGNDSEMKTLIAAVLFLAFLKRKKGELQS